MGVHITATYRCGGCGATVTGTTNLDPTLAREFVSLSGQDHAIGDCVTDQVKVESVAPAGWMPFDPFTQAAYCPACWASINGGPEPELTPTAGKDETR